MMIRKNELSWYPLRVTYALEMKVKEYLDKEGVDNFIPMRYEQKERHGVKTNYLVPVIHNLIFVRTDKEQLARIKSSSPLASRLRYIMDPVKKVPVTIPEKQMQDFIAVAGTCQQQILYLTPEETHLKKGCRVRINGGIWKGVEGKLVRIKKGLRVVVAIEGFMAVATACLHPSLVDRID